MYFKILEFAMGMNIFVSHCNLVIACGFSGFIFREIILPRLADT